jgi:hypothetical protein
MKKRSPTSRTLALATLTLAALTALTGCGGGSGSGGGTPSSPLVADWPADGNYLDIAGGNDGTPFGGVAFAAGHAGQAFAFNGTTARIFVPDSASLTLTHSMAITAWIDPAAYGSDLSMILFRGDDRNGLQPYTFFLNTDGTLAFRIEDMHANVAIVTSTAPIPLNTWTYVAASLDDTHSRMALYVNGTLVGSTTTAIRPSAGFNGAKNPGIGIGNSQGTIYAVPFDGLIDDLKVYNISAPAAQPPS